MQTDDSAKAREKLIADLRVVIADSEELLRATASQAGTRTAEARERIKQSLETTRQKLADAEQALMQRRTVEEEVDGILVFNIDGAVSTSDLAKFLQQFSTCYASIRFFLASTTQLPVVRALSLPVPDLPTVAQPMLVRASLHSPGFFEFLASLNPLKVLCDYLQQRHDRQKDIEYRNDAERQKLTLENLSLKNKILSDRVQVLRDAGFTQGEIRELLSLYIADPVERLVQLAPPAITVREMHDLPEGTDRDAGSK